MRRITRIVAMLLLALVPGLLAACGGAPEGAGPEPAAAESKTIVVTTSILGSVVEELVGDEAGVGVIVPNGLDPHEYEPSAKDVEAIASADLVVASGLGFETGLEGALAQAREAGIEVFTASDQVDVRRVGEGEGADPGDPDQQPGAEDPHFWMDPLAMKAVVAELAPVVGERLGVDVGARASDLERRLDSLDATVEETLAAVPEARRKLVSGHESMGYFARRYGFELIGAIVPSSSTQAVASASGLAELKDKIQRAGVPAIFTELGTSPDIAEALGGEAGVDVIELATAALPQDGSYFTFLEEVARRVAGGLG